MKKSLTHRHITVMMMMIIVSHDQALFSPTSLYNFIYFILFFQSLSVASTNDHKKGSTHTHTQKITDGKYIVYMDASFGLVLGDSSRHCKRHQPKRCIQYIIRANWPRSNTAKVTCCCGRLSRQVGCCYAYSLSRYRKSRFSCCCCCFLFFVT